MLKRILDIVLALLLLPLALAISIPVMIAIRIESPGSPLFLQKRVGRGKRLFTLWKLRSMEVGVAQVGSHDCSPARITRIGGFIRRTKIDELPQMVNVLVGDLSFVGPRPCLPNQSELIAEREARGVFDIRPGITGPAQLAGINMSTPRLLAETDARYIKERTLLGDMILIILTATGRGWGDTA